MPDPPKTRTFGGVTFVRTPGEPLIPQPVRIVAVIGFLLVAFHDLIYRQTGGDDFELLGIVSHAGADMLALVIVTSFALLLVPGRKP